MVAIVIAIVAALECKKGRKEKKRDGSYAATTARAVRDRSGAAANASVDDDDVFVLHDISSGQGLAKGLRG